MSDIFKFVKLSGTILLIFSVLMARVEAAPSAEQLRQFQSLPPEQQAALKEAYLGKNKAQPSVQQLEVPTVVVPRQLTESKVEQAAKASADVVTLEEKKEEKRLKERLEQFGYDLFAGNTTTFAPVSDIPIPSEYVVGPGDTLQVFLYGKESAEYALQVNREGVLSFPGIGPIQVAGMRFDELKNSLLERINQQMIGVRATITLGQLRSIRVFVLGDVQRPGSYTVSALSTMTNALFVSGGITKIGSLRNIQLKRKGKVVTSLDLYDLLLRGDTSKDTRIQPGDVLFVPPVGRVVGVGGEVRRPALYEIKHEKSLSDLLKMAGGLLPTADLESVQVERINASDERVLRDLSLHAPKAGEMVLQNGDIVRVYSVLEKMEQVVELTGHVQRPGGSEWFEGMRVSDLLRSSRDLLRKADLEYLLIKREQPATGKIEVLTTSLTEAWQATGGKADLLLMPRDQVTVLPLGKGRSEPLDQLTALLRLEERYGDPARVVSIYGNVRYPGEYPYRQKMQIHDLVRASMGVLPKTDMEYALLRREVGEARALEVHSFSLRKVMQGQSEQILQPGDKLLILSAEQEQEQERQKSRSELVGDLIQEMRAQATHQYPAPVVRIGGVVKFAGDYPLEPEMTLQQLVAAAGGYQESAYTLEAELTRREVVDGSYRDISHQIVRLGEHEGEAGDIVLQPHDFLNIHKLPLWDEREFVTIEGEVQFPGTYPVSRGETLFDLMQRAGGLTQYAFPQGAVFMRETLKKREQKEMDAVADRLQKQIGALSLEGGEKKEANTAELAMAKELVKQLRDTKALGRLAIDLELLLEGGESSLVLSGGDHLVVPSRSQEVTVLGEVFHPTSHLFEAGKNRLDYVNLSGGATKLADTSNVYVVRANGKVLAAKRIAWFRAAHDEEIGPGDTVVVPLDVRPTTFMGDLKDISQILYQLATTTAALQTVGAI